MRQAGSSSFRLLPVYCLLAVFVFGAFLFVDGKRNPENLTANSLSDSTLIALNGQTMGTSYRVLLHASAMQVTDRDYLGKAIAELTQYLDRDLMSTYAATSQLSLFNHSLPHTAVPVANEILEVLEVAQQVYRQSGGAFDITVKPLVDIWGFGVTNTVAIPAPESIEQDLAVKGMENIQVNVREQTITRISETTLDLSALAKGYAVDQTGQLLDAYGLEHYLVEIGGEVLVSGHRPDGKPWRLGIELPEAGEQQLFETIHTVSEKTAVAASGNYRNYFEHEGQRYSHIIDPQTGWPIKHDLVAVTVIADSVVLADAWATALLVSGLTEGMKLANELQLAAYFIVTGKTGFSAFHSDAFNQYLETSD